MFKFHSFLIVIMAVLMMACNGKKTEQPSGTEEQQIERYLKAKKIKVTETTPTGLRFVMVKPNPTGTVLANGQHVTVKYAGKLLSGEEFDAGEFSFDLAQGQVVGGFDEGIAKMKIGEKAVIIFPSSLGYGANGAGSDIPGNAPLVFDIEVLSAK